MAIRSATVETPDVAAAEHFNVSAFDPLAPVVARPSVDATSGLRGYTRRPASPKGRCAGGPAGGGLGVPR